MEQQIAKTANYISNIRPYILTTDKDQHMAGKIFHASWNVHLRTID